MSGMIGMIGTGSRLARIGAGGIAAATALLLCAGSASASHINSGAYYGNLSGGGTIEVLVSSDGNAADAVTGRNVPAFPDTCGDFVEGTANNVPITNHAYSVANGNPGVTSSGSFTDYGEVSGTYLVQNGGCSSGTQSFTGLIPADTLIGRSPDSSLLGDDLHSRTGANQIRKWNAKRGQTRSFDVQARNDGPVPEVAQVDGCASSNGFKVTFFDGANDVTGDVEGDQYSFNLDPNVGRTLQMKIKAKASARVGKTKSCAFGAEIHDTEDVVMAKVKVKSG
jgi:hypothetical protein